MVLAWISRVAISMHLKYKILVTVIVIYFGYEGSNATRTLSLLERFSKMEELNTFMHRCSKQALFADTILVSRILTFCVSEIW